VRIIAGWPLWFYELKDKACVNVELKDGEADESSVKKEFLKFNDLEKERVLFFFLIS